MVFRKMSGERTRVNAVSHSALCLLEEAIQNYRGRLGGDFNGLPAEENRVTTTRPSPNVSAVPHRARVAQLDRVAPSEGEGCGFNSRRAHHLQIYPRSKATQSRRWIEHVDVFPQP